LTAKEYGQQFGRSDQELQMVVSWLKGQGFKVDRSYSNRLAIGFSGTVETVQRAFKVQMGQYWDSVNNRSFYSNYQAPTLPYQMLPFTVDLIGLNNAVIYHHPVHHAQPAQSGATSSGPTAKGTSNATLRPDGLIDGQTFMGPADFATDYNFGPLHNANVEGQGQQVGIIIDSDVLDSDLAAYGSQFSLPTVNIQRMVLPGLGNPGITSDGETEADLDTQTIYGVAPMAQIDLITVPDLDDIYVQTAEQDVVQLGSIPIVNESFGGCEEETFSSSEQGVFQQATVEGVNFFAAAGDSGAECEDASGAAVAQVGCPACYGYVTSVGGTQVDAVFNSSGNLSQVISETVWNIPPGVGVNCQGQEISGGASGGGVSQLVSIPSYQQSAQGFAEGVPAGNFRYVPDVAALAGSPFTLIFSQGQGEFVGGTSLSSPLWAGMMGLINQYQGTPQGFANPTLYKLGVNQYKSGGTQVFTDITSGNNSIAPMSPCLPGGLTGYSAAPGYDPVSGLGVANADALAINFGPGSGGGPNPSCTYSLGSTSQSFQSTGGTGNFTVSAGSTCAWTATSSESWITVTSGASGTGPGTVDYSVAANSTSNQRTGTVSVAGDTFTISQLGQSSTGGGGTVELAVDDGNLTDAIGADGGGTQYGVNRLTPASYPSTLSQINLYFASNTGVSVGENITLVYGSNTGGSNDIDGITLQSVNATIEGLDTFTLYTVPSLTIDSGDFVVGFEINTPANVDAFAESQDPPLEGRSYVSTDGSNFFVIDTIEPSLAGNLMIRAEVTEGGGSPAPAPSPSPTPTPSTPSVPTVSSLSANLVGNLLTVSGAGTDTEVPMAQIDVKLQDASNNTLVDTGAVSGGFGTGLTSNFLYQFTNMATYPSAVIATVVITDSDGHSSQPVSVNFGSGSPGGPHISNVALSSSALVITGTGFAKGVQLDVNGVLVTPPLTVKVKGSTKLKISGKVKTMNLMSGANRIQIILGGLQSNIFVFTE
ncbi:MAG TPA: protease pro-enzyme activation domain-containing protein, partial [Blastocatellia bacterium]